MIRAQFAGHLESVADLHAHECAKCRLICRAMSLIHRHSKDIGSMRWLMQSAAIEPTDTLRVFPEDTHHGRPCLEADREG